MYEKDTQQNKDYSKLPRAEKLYILSQICIQNSVTPNSQGFNGLIVRVCTSKFATSKEKASQYAADLISAYEADMWEGLAAAHQPEDADIQISCTPQVFETITPTLQTLNFKSSGPVQHVEKQLAYTEPQYAPKTVAAILYKIAKNNDFNGVGRINLAEARSELDDKTLRCEDIKRLLHQYYPTSSVEQRAGNNILIYFTGKNSVQAYRNINRVIQPSQPKLIETVVQPEKEYAETEVMADKSMRVPEGEEE